MLNLNEASLKLHEKHKGKLEVVTKVAIENGEDLSLAYSPGVAEPCREIYKDKELAYKYTIKGNTVAVVSDGSAVLGLGNIGPHAALPVMEGKAALFKTFAGVDAFPLCVNTNDPEKIIELVTLLEPTFGGINLEDISSPNCFIIEKKLKETLKIPVFHDDQHGTAIVTVAALINSLKLAKKNIEEIKVVMNGAGAAGIAIAKLLNYFGAGDIIMCDSKGAICKGRKENMNSEKEYVLTFTNKNNCSGSLSAVIKNADVFIGVSVADTLTKDMIKSMNENAIIFAQANPDPEISPKEAIEAGCLVIGTGRSDYPNQINNVLAFPGVFRGALDVRATEINEEMKIAAAKAIAELVNDDELKADYVIPSPFDKRVAPQVAKSVAEAAINSGVATFKMSLEEIVRRTEEMRK